MGFSNMMMAAAKSIPKSTISQSIPSLTYSSCSTTNICWLKNCWSFSLTKLIEICSKPLYSKISNPAISKTAQKLAFLRVGSIRVSLHFSMSHLKILSYTALAIPPSIASLDASLTLDDPLGSNLDPRLTESLDHGSSINSKSSSHLSWEGLRSNSLAFSLVITTFGLELNATTGHDTSSQHVTVKLLLLCESKNIEGIFSVFELLVVIDGCDSSLTLGDVDVFVDVTAETTLLSETSLANTITVRLAELVEDVVRSFDLLLLSDSGLLKKIGNDVTASQLARSSEVNTDEFTETGGVVIPGSFSITIGLKDWVGGNNLVFKGDLLLNLFACSSGNHSQVGDDLLGVLCLSSTGLSSDQHSVVFLILQHVPVGSLSNGPQVRGALVPPLSKVYLADPVGVDGVPLVGVHHNNEETGVGVDHLSLVASLQVPEDRGVVEEGQVDHVHALLELGRVHSADSGCLHGNLLVTDSNDTLGGGVLEVPRLEETLLVSSSLIIRDPDGLLRVVRLLLVRPLHVDGGEEVLSGVRVGLTRLGELDVAGHGDS